MRLNTIFLNCNSPKNWLPVVTNGHFIHFLKIFRFVNSPNVDSVKPVKIWLSLVVADGANRLAKRGGRFG